MDDLRRHIGREIGTGTSGDLTQSCRRHAHNTLREHRTLGVGDLDGIVDVEVSDDIDDTSAEQRDSPALEGSPCAGIHGDHTG